MLFPALWVVGVAMVHWGRRIACQMQQSFDSPWCLGSSVHPKICTWQLHWSTAVDMPVWLGELSWCSELTRKLLKYIEMMIPAFSYLCLCFRTFCELVIYVSGLCPGINIPMRSTWGAECGGILPWWHCSHGKVVEFQSADRLLSQTEAVVEQLAGIKSWGHLGMDQNLQFAVFRHVFFFFKYTKYVYVYVYKYIYT
jgi:hypothetical protein